MQSHWYKSSHSNANGQCLETRFQKSSYSTLGNACVEAALHGSVLVRDSKDVTIPGLGFTPEAWSAFIKTIK